MPVKDSTTAHCHFDLAKLHGSVRNLETGRAGFKPAPTCFAIRARSEHLVIDPRGLKWRMKKPGTLRVRASHSFEV
jgi:hypothetical protein